MSIGACHSVISGHSEVYVAGLKAEHAAYVEGHPELKNILADFMTRVLLEKPDDVPAFAAEHFTAFRKEGGEAEGGEGKDAADEAKDGAAGAEGDVGGAAGEEGAASGGGPPPAPLVVCGPSGVGKGTLINRLLEDLGRDALGFSVSHTTRAPRDGEEDGVHYHFTDVETMRREIGEG